LPLHTVYHTYTLQWVRIPHCTTEVVCRRYWMHLPGYVTCLPPPHDLPHLPALPLRDSTGVRWILRYIHTCRAPPPGYIPCHLLHTCTCLGLPGPVRLAFGLHTVGWSSTFVTTRGPHLRLHLPTAITWVTTCLFTTPATCRSGFYHHFCHYRYCIAVLLPRLPLLPAHSTYALRIPAGYGYHRVAATGDFSPPFQEDTTRDSAGHAAWVAPACWTADYRCSCCDTVGLCWIPALPHHHVVFCTCSSGAAPAAGLDHLVYYLLLPVYDLHHLL